MKFIVAEQIFQKLPNACFGVVMARGLKNDRPQPAVAQAFEAALAAAQARFRALSTDRRRFARDTTRM